jgi:glutamate racemase
MNKIDHNAIGVFDSGIGGLTVVKRIIELLPHENVIYFGDIARLPYGTKSPSNIKKFAIETVSFLLSQKVKAIVIACNTISAIAKTEIQNLARNVPVIDVITAGGSDSAFISRNNRIGIIATPATINSDSYTQIILKLNPVVKIFSQACSLFVPFIEEGFEASHPALELVAKDYLQYLINNCVDTVILGCTHYPVILPLISAILGKDIQIIDPAIPTCKQLFHIMKSRDLLNPQSIKGHQNFFVTEVSPAFTRITQQLLNLKNCKPILINL